MSISYKLLTISGIVGATLAGTAWLGAAHFDNMRSNIHTLTSTISVLTEDAEQFSYRHQIFIENTSKEISSRQSQLDGLANQILLLENEVQTSDKELDALHTEQYNLEQQIALKEALIERLTYERNNLLAEGERPSEILAELNREITRLTVESIKLNEQRDSLLESIALYEQQFSDALSEGGRISFQIHLLNLEINDLTDQLHLLENEHDQLVSELNQANNEIYQLSMEVQIATQEALDVFESRAVPTDMELELPTAP